MPGILVNKTHNLIVVNSRCLYCSMCPFGVADAVIVFSYPAPGLEVHDINTVTLSQYNLLLLLSLQVPDKFPFHFAVFFGIVIYK